MPMNIIEILVIVLVALLVIKPERLPETARTLGRWVKWLRNTTAKIRDEFSNDKQQ